jgi:hypothetical protein
VHVQSFQHVHLRHFEREELGLVMFLQMIPTTIWRALTNLHGRSTGFSCTLMHDATKEFEVYTTLLRWRSFRSRLLSPTLPGRVVKNDEFYFTRAWNFLKIGNPRRLKFEPRSNLWIKIMTSFVPWFERKRLDRIFVVRSVCGVYVML